MSVTVTHLNVFQVQITEEMLEEILYFANWSFPEDTTEEILNKHCLALTLKPANEEVGEHVEEVVLQLIYGNTKEPPGAPGSPAQILMRLEEEEKTEEDENKEKPELTEEEKEEQKKAQEEKEEERKKAAEIMALWAPPNARTKAYVIKVLFPNLAGPLILPEPEPIPPHLALIYDAVHRREVLEVMNQYPDDVMRYGFFTTEDPHTAKLVAKTPANFERKLATAPTQ